MRILVVEDEVELLDAIAEGLRLDGYAVDTCSNGIDAYERLYVTDYDLVILDLNLPGMGGLEVLEKIRKDNKNLKVLILSARGLVEDRVLGLDLGANDYLTKPFAFEELEARIRGLLRREFISHDNIVKFNNISLDISKREIRIDQTVLNLTNKEFGIMEYFMLNQNRVISQEEIIEHVWDSDVDVFSGAIRVHMTTLRKKLKEALNYDPITTKIGAGYILEDIENV